MTAIATASKATAQKVFICYRRDETAAHAGRLYDAMVNRFGEGNVFMDVELGPGVDFVERITEVVSGCLALIVVMGPKWATAEDEEGGRRLEDPADFVRLEVETGLERGDVMPIPVLVSGARMPRKELLPEPLRPLTRRNALELSEARWGYDVGRLFGTLDELLPSDGARPLVTSPTPPPAPAPPPSRGNRLVLEGMAVAGLAAVTGRALAAKISGQEAIDNEVWSETREHIVREILRRTETLALVGAALAVWLAMRVLRVDPVRPGLRGLLIGACAGLISGVIYTLPVFLPDDKVEFDSRAQIELGAIFVSAGLLGAVIGSLWSPKRTGVGFLCGAGGGVLFQLIVIATGWKNTSAGEIILSFGLASAMIAGLTIAAMLALDRRELRATRAPLG
jgi:TIR domain